MGTRSSSPRWRSRSSAARTGARAGPVLVAPAVLYGIWYLAYGGDQGKQSVDNLLATPAYIAEAAAGAAGAVFGLGFGVGAAAGGRARGAARARDPLAASPTRGA